MMVIGGTGEFRLVLYMVPSPSSWAPYKTRSIYNSIAVVR